MLIKYVIFFPDGKKRTRKNVSNVKKSNSVLELLYATEATKINEQRTNG